MSVQKMRWGMIDFGRPHSLMAWRIARLANLRDSSKGYLLPKVKDGAMKAQRLGFFFTVSSV